LPRNAYVAWATPAGLLTAGAQSLTWGAGMLVNDGAGDRAFGDAWQGNVAARVAFGTRPLQGSLLPRMLESAVVFAGGDYVLRDDNASVYDGDRAVAAVAGIRTHEGVDAFGVLLSIRHQVDREDRYRPGERAKTTAYVIDVHARSGLTLSDASRLVAEVEAATLRGHSTRPWSDATWRDGADVRQLGGIARLRVDLDRLHATTSLEGGYASVDNGPRDTVARTFTMSTDYNVGMVLFDHVLPLLTARGVDRAADASLVGQPSPSTRFAINPGAVQNARDVWQNSRDVLVCASAGGRKTCRRVLRGGESGRGALVQAVSCRTSRTGTVASRASSCSMRGATPRWAWRLVPWTATGTVVGGRSDRVVRNGWNCWRCAPS